MMRFIIDREQLLKGLNIAGKAIGSKSPIPIMMNFKISLAEDGLSIIGSNSEITIKTVIPYMIAGKQVISDAKYGSTLLASKYVTEIVRKIEGDMLTFEIIDETIVKISDARSNFKLNSIKAEEYPEIDLEDQGTTISLTREEFQTLVNQTSFAASNKEQRPILMAINLQAGENKLVATATDSARLAKKEIPLENDLGFMVNIPAKVMEEVGKLLEGTEPVQLSVSSKKVLFIFDNTIVSSRLIGGEYPNIKNIIPRAFNYTLEINARELVSAMERVSLLSIERENVVKMTLSNEEILISAKSTQVGSAIERIDTFQYSGERLEISFNAGYVADAVKACRSEDVTILFLGEMKPFIVKNAKDESLVQLVTPVRTY